MLLADAATFALPPSPLPRGAGVGSAARRPRRGPRAEEIALMRGLAAGPRAVTEGPIGRCVKRGWCRALVVEGGEGGKGGGSGTRVGTVVFVLTEAGRDLIG